MIGRTAGNGFFINKWEHLDRAQKPETTLRCLHHAEEAAIGRGSCGSVPPVPFRTEETKVREVIKREESG